VRNLDDADAKSLVGKIKGDARLASVRDAAKDADVVGWPRPMPPMRPRLPPPAILPARFSST
jgi:hypothetical protein